MNEEHTAFAPQTAFAPLTAFIGLGSNLGDRAGQMRAALVEIANTEDVNVQAVSGVYESEAFGMTNAGDFLNAVAQLSTCRPAGPLLEWLLTVERTLGRERRQNTDARWVSRSIDLDLLLYDGLVIDEPHLTVPHPGLTERRFVLAPLADLAAEVVHPLSGETIQHLLETCPDTTPTVRTELSIWPA